MTDSSADWPAQLVDELGITVVPLTVRFGNEVYRDGIDINAEGFYEKLVNSPIHPITFHPSPWDFAEVYQKLSHEADGIVSIHISSKQSGTYSSALQAKAQIKKGCPIEVVDSQAMSITLGLINASAATVAKDGGSITQVLEEVQQAIHNIHGVTLLDTLKYVLLGGRIGKARALVGSVLNVKPFLALKDGEVMVVGQVHSRAKGIDNLYTFVQNASTVQELAIAYNTTPDEAQDLAERFSSIVPKERIKMPRIGPVLGVHLGPGALVVAFRGEVREQDVPPNYISWYPNISG